MDEKNEKFKVWLDTELGERGWSIRELGRRCNFTFGHIANIARGIKPVTWDVVADIARTFGIRPECAFRRVGLLPESSERFEELKGIVSELPPDKVEDVIKYADWRRNQ